MTPAFKLRGSRDPSFSMQLGRQMAPRSCGNKLATTGWVEIFFLVNSFLTSAVSMVVDPFRPVSS